MVSLQWYITLLVLRGTVDLVMNPIPDPSQGHPDIITSFLQVLSSLTYGHKNREVGRRYG